MQNNVFILLYRVPGTVRDFAPFTGSSNGNVRKAICAASTGGLTKFVTAAASALGCSLSAVNLFSNTGTEIQNLYTGGVLYAATDGGLIAVNSGMYNSASAMGEDLVARQPKISKGASVIESTGASTSTTAYSSGVVTMVIPATNNQYTLSANINPALVVGSVVRITSGANIGLEFSIIFISSSTVGFADISSEEIATGTFTYIMPTAVGATQYYVENANPLAGQGYALSVTSNLPKPQYVPIASVWANKGTDGVSNYINENQSCYGSYLPASVPQSRRCQSSSRLQIGNGSNSVSDPMANGVTIFTIRDLQYIGEQVQLDDISTAAIIQQAATSEIVVWTRG